MMKLSLVLSACLIHLSCINEGQTSSGKNTKPNPAGVAPILWTAESSPDGKLYAVGGNDSILKVYQADSHEVVHSFKLPASVQCVDWHKDGTLLAIALADNPVQILDITTLKFQHLGGTRGSRALDWNHNGQLLAVGDDDENTIQIWSKEGRLLRTIPKRDNKSYLSVEWHPGKNILLTGSDKIRIYDSLGNMLQNIKHRQEETPILTVRWHPGGKFFATGDYGEPENSIESLLQFWSTDGALIKTMHGSKAEYRTLRWNANGDLLASASDALRLWSKGGQLVHAGSSEDLLWGLDWNSQKNTILTGSREGRITLWTGKTKLLKRINSL